VALSCKPKKLLPRVICRRFRNAPEVAIRLLLLLMLEGLIWCRKPLLLRIDRLISEADI